MIQRIQTVYLAVAAIVMALLFAFPLGNFYSDMNVYSFSIIGVKSMVPGSLSPFNTVMFIPMIVTVLAIIGLFIFTITQYKNRRLQIKLINIANLLLIVLIAGIFFGYIPLIEKKTLLHIDYSKVFAIYFPMIALVLGMLASKAVRRDEKLVRSADRLR